MPDHANSPPELQVGSGLPERWQDRVIAVLEDELRRSGVSSSADWQAADECFSRLGAVPVGSRTYHSVSRLTWGERIHARPAFPENNLSGHLRLLIVGEVSNPSSSSPSAGQHSRDVPSC